MCRKVIKHDKTWFRQRQLFVMSFYTCIQCTHVQINRSEIYTVNHAENDSLNAKKEKGLTQKAHEEKSNDSIKYRSRTCF